MQRAHNKFTPLERRLRLERSLRLLKIAKQAQAWVFVIPCHI